MPRELHRCLGTASGGFYGPKCAMLLMPFLRNTRALKLEGCIFFFFGVDLKLSVYGWVPETVH